METGKLIKELRIKKGLTQEELANKTEVSARTIQRIENGEVDPRAYTLQMIAKALDVEFSLFVDNEPQKNQVDDTKWLALLHLTGVIPLIIPTLLMWKNKKNKTEAMPPHFRAVLTLQLGIWAICLIGLWIYWKVNQPIPLIGGILVGGLVSIANAIFVLTGKPCINPFIKPLQ